MTYLPAPYESAPHDDLAAAVAAGLTVTTAGINAWMIGSWTWTQGQLQLERSDLSDLPTDVLMMLGGWAAATVMLALGALLLVFRRGRSLLGWGAALSLAGAAYGQFHFGFGERLAVPQWPLYWGGIVVLVLVALPATGRWVHRKPKPAPALIGTATTGGALF